MNTNSNIFISVGNVKRKQKMKQKTLNSNRIGW